MSPVESDAYNGPAYNGPASVDFGYDSVAVRIHLRLRFEPTAGRYHWGGRVEPAEAIAAARRAGVRAVTVRIGQGTPSPARLGETDPWGGVRIQGTGRPPWTPDQPRREAA